MVCWIVRKIITIWLPTERKPEISGGTSLEVWPIIRIKKEERKKEKTKTKTKQKIVIYSLLIPKQKIVITAGSLIVITVGGLA